MVIDYWFYYGFGRYLDIGNIVEIPDMHKLSTMVDSLLLVIGYGI